MGKYIVIYHNERTIFASEGIPEMDLKQFAKEFDSYEEAISCFRWAITEAPGYICRFKNPPKEVEKLDAANQLIAKIQKDSQYVPTSEDIVECEISEDNGRGAYCCVTPEQITLGDAGFLLKYYLTTNIHSFSDSQSGYYIFKTSYEDILNGGTEMESFCVTINPVE